MIFRVLTLRIEDSVGDIRVVSDRRITLELLESMSPKCVSDILGIEYQRARKALDIEIEKVRTAGPKGPLP